MDGLYVFDWNGAFNMKRLTSMIRIYLLISCLGGISTLTAPIVSAAPAASEQTLTAAFLYNFMKFTEWPQGIVTDHITLCSTKSSPFEELDAINGRAAQSKPVRIKRTSINEPLDDCQLLFLPREENIEQVRQWLKIIGNQPILIVSNINGFLDMGGMVSLINDGKNLNFEVNLEKVKHVGLKLNAQLLQIARDVRGR